MKNVKVVIGANYGDEGKGRIVDYLVSQVDPKDILNTLVVRFNGGAQAGHTVQTDKIRHVFSHFGSGTICGAPTYLSKFFVVNPMAFADEYLELVKKGIYPIIYIDEDAEITTPFDVLINQNYEIAKSAHIRGSVGMAVWETTERAKYISIKAKDLHCPNILNQKVIKMVNDWFLKRSTEYHMTHEARKQIYTQGESIKQAFLYYCEFMKRSVGIVSHDIMNEYDNVIFEGAQGLLLDISLDYTFGTASHTGLENVVDLIGGSILNSFTVIYATRPYLTRHGGGALPYEQDITKMGINCVDATNGFNVWQREFRKSLLDVNAFGKNIERDMQFSKSILAKQSEMQLFFSCVDHISNPASYHYIDLHDIMTDYVLSTIRTIGVRLNATKVFYSYGPERTQVQHFVL